MQDYYYQQMMANGQSMSSQGGGGASSNGAAAAGSEDSDGSQQSGTAADNAGGLPSNSQLPPSSTDPDGETNPSLVPGGSSNGPTIATVGHLLLPKPDAIKNAELLTVESQQLLGFDTGGIVQNLIEQTSLLGASVANSANIATTSSTFSINKLLIAAILSLIPTIAIAIPFLAPHLMRRRQKRIRSYHQTVW